MFKFLKETFVYLKSLFTGVIEIEAPAFATILDFSKQAITLAKRRNKKVRFRFSGITITVTGDSDPELVYRDYRRALLNQSGRTEIGPFYAEENYVEELAREAAYQLQISKEAEKRVQELLTERKEKRERLLEKIADTPMSFANRRMWDEKLDDAQHNNPYVLSIFTYAQHWARLMEWEMDNGKELAEIVYSSAEEADLDGVSGTSFAYAVILLFASWLYGDELENFYDVNGMRTR